MKKNEKKYKQRKKSGEDKKDSGGADNARARGQKVRFSLRIKFYLIMIPIVSIVISVMAIFFINEESNLLTKEIIKFAEREIGHLNNTASLSILPDGDILPLLDALRDIRKITSIQYAYVLDSENRVIQYFAAGSTEVTEKKGIVMNDDITAKAAKYTRTEKPLLIIYPDPKDRDGSIYDFSMPIMHPVYKKDRMGTVRLGFSDKIIRDEIEKITKTIMISAVLFLAIAILGAFLSSRMIIRPIEILSRGASIIGTGQLDYKIDLKRSDELGKLANEFNIMTEELKKGKEAEISSRIMQEQLELAREIQEGLNPMQLYNRDGIQIKGFTRAAKGVGGDYFDYIDIDDKRVGVLISDVSGKGVPASLVMVMIRTVFVTYIKGKDVNCASMVKAINDSLSADFAIDKFATLFFMIYNKETGELSFSNAGHGPLFCYRASLGGCTISKLDGMPIGIMEDAEYLQSRVKLSEGDIVVLYTDGITEMRNEKKEDYGLNRLKRLMVENAHSNADELVEKIVRDVDDFKGNEPPHDDMTVLIFKKQA
ncbi:MAG: SpoIIE family protein phosphatase [Spirochaetes bacterium]|jgi:sigma-B regulation protein RsbU (phosphoserine phosphatase)|nr:SpoIIE family protein phosphatase [Spirochaetota bacterium]